MTLLRRLLALLGALICASGCSIALAAVPESRPYVSPEVHADRTVTFRILAPTASEVTLEGGWMASKQTTPLVKDENGLWSVTVGPLKPTVYAYWFNLDGAVVLDEANEVVRERTGGSSVNSVDVPGDGSLPWSLRDVPHGAVDIRLIPSKVYGETRPVWTYLPPGYGENPGRKYPILYLFHGAGELQLSWVESGKANLIFDNLIADGKMVPAVVVMPYTGRTPNPPPITPGGGPNLGPRPDVQGQDFVINELMPWAEAHYRLLPGRRNRAVAGLSAGGLLATGVAFKDLADVSQLGVFSGAIRSFPQVAPEVLTDPADVNARLDLFWIGVGRSDPGIGDWLREGDVVLTKAGVRHTFVQTEGAHDYAVWRWCLVQFAPLLFRR